MSASSKSDAPDILYISGSPRAHTCEALIDIIESGARAAHARSQHFYLSKKQIVPCTGCNACIKTGICVLASRTVGDKMIDDYLELKAAMERVDALVLVAPLFFAGPPAQLKALFDRMQPYWTQKYILGQSPRVKRPAQLFIVGGGDAYGHDPHGHDPLVGITKSALAVAGFNLEKVHSFVGFRSGKDRPVLPSEEQRGAHPMGEMAQLKRAIAAQEDFEQRARDAGGALARFVLWARTAKPEPGGERPEAAANDDVMQESKSAAGSAAGEAASAPGDAVANVLAAAPTAALTDALADEPTGSSNNALITE